MGLSESLGALSAGLAVIVGVALFASLVVPSTLLLLASPPGQGTWRWPILWLGPSVGAWLLLGICLPSSIQEDPSALWWTALGIYAVWGFSAAAIGVPNLLIRVVKFAFAPDRSSAPPRAATRFLYGWGALFSAAVLFLVALAGGLAFAWQALWALGIGLLGWLNLRPRSSQRPFPPSTRVRLAWLASSVLVALLSPIALLLVGAMIHLGPQTTQGGISKGVPLTVVVLLVWAGCVWMQRRANRARLAT